MVAMTDICSGVGADRSVVYSLVCLALVVSIASLGDDAD